MAHGLHPAHALAEANGIDPRSLALRKDRTRLSGPRPALLNHQQPILRGRRAADRIVEGHDAESWAGVLDRRVFFWPQSRGARFSASIRRDVETATLWLDAHAFARAFAQAIDLSPINSGNFTQGGATAARGDWLFVPLTAGLEAFRDNRRARGLVRGRDGVCEISLRAGIDPESLRALLLTIERAERGRAP